VAVAIATDVPLAPLTTLELGGPARFLAEPRTPGEVLEALRWADARGVPLFVLGGGSNLVVGDGGFDGLVVRTSGLRGLRWTEAGDSGEVLVEAQAGEPWDDLVAASVARGLAGLECLAGIPGLTGATPIQNVGAYGQEVAETIRAVEVLDRRTLAVSRLGPGECDFAYRDSAFKRAPDRHLVLSVTFALSKGGPPAVRYGELRAALAAVGSAAPTVAEVRTTVLALRRRKSMVLDPADPNRRSVGSFFTNPVLPAARAEEVIARAVAAGAAARPEDVPRFPAGEGLVKLAAGWLIERAGIARGMRRGAVGVSTAHALALVHHGGGTAAELAALAREVRAAVEQRFGVTLVPEPTLLGITLG
jgi:UDP-N-acetylmuramate dehydrogenase